jgi:tetratricopeptide (TPR) repeat protein
MDAKDEAIALDDISIGLNNLKEYEDALPLTRRCLAIKPDAAYCFTDMGVSYEGLGHLQDARQSYRNAIAIGGYDVANAGAIELAKKRLAALDLRDDGAENLRAENPPPSSEPSPAEPQACSKVVSFGVLVQTPRGIQLLKGEPSWLNNWVRKNSTKYPDICFSQSPMQGRANYLVVLSDSPHYFHGFEPVVRTNTRSHFKTLRKTIMKQAI